MFSLERVKNKRLLIDQTVSSHPDSEANQSREAKKEREKEEEQTDQKDLKKIFEKILTVRWKILRKL